MTDLRSKIQEAVEVGFYDAPEECVIIAKCHASALLDLADRWLKGELVEATQANGIDNDGNPIVYGLAGGPAQQPVEGVEQ